MANVKIRVCFPTHAVTTQNVRHSNIDLDASAMKIISEIRTSNANLYPTITAKSTRHVHLEKFANSTDVSKAVETMCIVSLNKLASTRCVKTLAAFMVLVVLMRFASPPTTIAFAAACQNLRVIRDHCANELNRHQNVQSIINAHLVKFVRANAASMDAALRQIVPRKKLASKVDASTLVLSAVRVAVELLVLRQIMWQFATVPAASEEIPMLNVKKFRLNADKTMIVDWSAFA